MALSPPKVPPSATEPVATKGAIPIAYEILGLQVHLEELAPQDESQLDEAMSKVQEWIGSRLHWVFATATGESVDFDSESLEYVTTYPRRLLLPPEVLDLPFEQQCDVVPLLIDKAAEYAVACGGSSLAEREHAQVVSFRFYADVNRILPDRTHISPYSVLRATVPSDTPLPEFENWCRCIIERLPVRWATAGLMLSGAEREHWKDWTQIAAAYCMRYWGVDVGEYVGLTDSFYDWIRTVNWLTFLGPTMQRDLEHAEVALEPTAEVSIEPLSSGTLVLKAGAAPERGDINRLEVPQAYAAVDRMVRPRRCAGFDDEGEPISFCGGWSRTQEWLRRFEKYG